MVVIIRCLAKERNEDIYFTGLFCCAIKLSAMGDMLQYWQYIFNLIKDRHRKISLFTSFGNWRRECDLRKSSADEWSLLQRHRVATERVRDMRTEKFHFLRQRNELGKNCNNRPINCLALDSSWPQLSVTLTHCHSHSRLDRLPDTDLWWRSVKLYATGGDGDDDYGDWIQLPLRRE